MSSGSAGGAGAAATSHAAGASADATPDSCGRGTSRSSDEARAPRDPEPGAPLRAKVEPTRLRCQAQDVRAIQEPWVPLQVADGHAALR